MTHVALWDFNDSSTVTDDITSDGAAQGGTYEYGASASGGKLQLDGVDDYALIPADPVFQLACGTLVTEFNPDTLQNAVLLSRDSNGNDNGGHFELRLDDSGQISVRTQDSTLSSFYETPSGFYTAGDDIRVTFSWDHGGSGGEYKVENLTQGTKHSQPVSSNVTWDMGSGYNEPITIGANQDLSSDNTADNLREFFSGSVSYVSLFDEVVDPGGPVMPVSGTPNDDMLTGTGIRDDISGLEGDDNLKGGAGDDTLRGGGGNDWLSGLGGDDTLVGGAGADTMFGGSGDDFVSYWNSESGVNVDLLTNKSSGGSAQGDKIYDVEGVIGSDHADTITGSIGNDTLLGGAGDDRIVGGRGSDTLNGGTGNDTFVFTSATSNDWVEDFDFGDDDGDGYTNDQLDVSGLTSDGGTTPVTTDDVVLKSTGHNGSGSAVLVFPGGERITLGGISPHLVNDLAVLHAMGIPLGTKDGVVNGTNSNDSIVSGYIDSDGDAVDSNDNLAGNNHDFIDARAGNDTISAGAGNDTVFGGSGNDLVFGGTEDDWLEGDSGSDTLYAGNGSDTISGGDGYDFLYGDAGDDVIFGGDGGDIIAGGARDDSLFGGDGNDELYGGGGYDVDVGGADTLVGGAGQDIMAGGAGDDVFVFADGSGKDQINDFDFRDANADGYANDQLDVSGLTAAGGTTSVTTDDVVITDANGDGTGDAILTFPGGESIRLVGITAAKVSDPMVLHAMGIPLGIRYGVVDGTAGDDTIHGSYVDAEGDAIGSGNDMVAAGDGDDDVFTEGGDDSVSGGDGNDIINGGAGADVLDGGAGNDTVRYSSSTEAVVVDLSTNTTSGGDATGDVISGFENVWGGAGDDTLTGDDAGNSFAGGAGNDSISGGGGNDRFHGGQGADTLDGGTGSNYLTYYSDTVGVNVDLVTGVGLGGEAEGDVISNIQHIEGGKGNDTLTGDMADNVLYGHGGDDIISGGDGDDGIIGGPGADTLDGGAGSDWVDYFHSTAGVTVDFSTNTASGGEAQGDVISNFEHIRGGSGHDSLTGDADDNAIVGQRGDDTITGGAGNDTLRGGDYELGSGSDNDTFVFADGFGQDVIRDFDLGDDDADGFTNDQLDVSGLTSDAGTTPVIAGDVVISDTNGNGTGHAVLIFPGGERITLEGIALDQLNNPAVLGTMGIPLSIKDGIVDGTASGDVIDGTFIDADGDRVDGNDNLAGTHDDVIDAGAGHDVVNAGVGDDTIFGSSGHDILLGEDGNDTLFGGTDDDWLGGGNGNDKLNGDQGDDLIYGGNDADTFVVDQMFGNDLIFGGEGGNDFDAIRTSLGDLPITDNVTVTYTADEAGLLSSGTSTLTFAEIEMIETGAGDDTIDASLDRAGGIFIAGAGDDNIIGGSGDDRLDGGMGNDTLDGGGGNDTLTGGTDADTFRFAGGAGADLIQDFDMGDDDTDGRSNDQFDVSNLTDTDGNPVNAWDVIVTDTNGDGTGDAMLTFPNGESITLKGVTRDQVNSASQLKSIGIPCYVSGTLIKTDKGDVPVEHLKKCDMVLTGHGVHKPIQWLEKTTISKAQQDEAENLRPVRIAPGTWGNKAALFVSQQHCMVIDVDGQSKFIRAKHLAKYSACARIPKPKGDVTYHHILLPSHAVIFANGAASESFYPGPHSVKMLSIESLSSLTKVIAADARQSLEKAYGNRCLPALKRKDVEALDAIAPCIFYDA